MNTLKDTLCLLGTPGLRRMLEIRRITALGSVPAFVVTLFAPLETAGGHEPLLWAHSPRLRITLSVGGFIYTLWIGGDQATAAAFAISPAEAVKIADWAGFALPSAPAYPVSQVVA